MGNKKEAVRMIMTVMPEWESTCYSDARRCDYTLRGVRLDSDTEVVATTAQSDAEIQGDPSAFDFWSMGFTTATGERNGRRHETAEWFVEASSAEGMGSGLIGHVFDRMEYEIFRAAILQEREDGRQERSSESHTAKAAGVES